MASWTTDTEQKLRAEIAQWQQRCAHYEGKCAGLEQTIELLKASMGETAREEANGRLKARVVELEGRLNECLVRATQPPTAVVPALFGNGQR